MHTVRGARQRHIKAPDLLHLEMANICTDAMQFAQQACSSFLGASVPIPSSTAGYGNDGSSPHITSETVTDSPLSSTGLASSGSTSKSTEADPSPAATTSTPSPTVPTTTQPSRSSTPISWGLSIKTSCWQYLAIFFVALVFAPGVMP